MLVLNSGLRRGEALGLRWEDVDFTTGTITVAQQLVQVDGVPTITKPKTAKSQRIIAIGPRTVEVLRQHQARQAAERFAAEDWVDTGLVFTKPDGQWIRPDRIYVVLRRLVERAGVPFIGVHGLRQVQIEEALAANLDALRPRWKLKLVQRQFVCGGLGRIDLLCRQRNGNPRLCDR